MDEQDEMDQDYKNRQSRFPDMDSTPFAAPEDVGQPKDIDHPQTDTNVDRDEAYQEGLEQASGLQDLESKEQKKSQDHKF